MNNLKKVCFLIIIVIMGNMSCRKNTPFTTEANIESPISFDLEREIVKIPIDSITMHDFSFLQFIRQGSFTGFLGYNQKTHSLDIIDLENRKVRDHIKFEKEGPNAVLRMNGFFYHNEDSIFVFDGTNLCVLNSMGVIETKQNIVSTVSDSDEPDLLYFPHSDYFSDLRYFPDTKSIYFRAVYSDRLLIRGIYKRGLILEYNLGTDTITRVLPAYASNLIINNPELYGMHSAINYRCGREHIYFNFPAESNIYSLDLAELKTLVHGGVSRFTKNSADILQKEEDYYFQYYKEEVFFYPLLFPEDESYFIRMHWGELPLKTINDDFSLLKDKPLYLMVFDKDLKYVTELELNNSEFYVGGAFCDSDAFYIFKNNNAPEDSESIILYKFKIKTR